MEPSFCLEHVLGPAKAPGVRETRAVAVNTLFGSFTVDGTSGGLGNDNDSAVLAGLREWADIILVASGTVKKEGYGPADAPMAIVSRSLNFDLDTDLFRDSVPLILTPDESLASTDEEMRARRERLASISVQLVGTGGGSPQEIMEALWARGFARVTCEGGPSLYAALLKHSLIDVLHLTLDPRLPDELTALPLNKGADTSRWTLEHLAHDEDSMIFARYRRGADD